MDHGSLAVVISVDDQFLAYESGVYTAQAPTATVNHVITVVGWEEPTELAGASWIAKNSWGSNWGDGGWIKFPIAGNVLNQIGRAHY